MLLHPHPANIQADEWTPNMILNSTDGQDDLPRYFARVMGMATSLRHGRIDFILPDGRHFRAEGAKPGPVAELHIHNTDLFARLIREGDLGFCDAYLVEHARPASLHGLYPRG